MSEFFQQDELVQHAPQRPSGRTGIPQFQSYTIVKRMPIEADGRIRYRIRSVDSTIERVVTEEQLSRVG